MSREGYQVPTGSAVSPFDFGTSQQRQASFSAGGAANPSDNEPLIRYLCGDCGTPNQLKKSQPVQCLDCGCRVLYKERTKR
ncbi:metallothionein-I gene transcription activator [Cryphonectria parasitica EP155]|uniref:Metallothionein-I gene transcription activator n=1 Tax=Cryphonectria parasitica (strain ATCC 38755 / EP155) TaxID=660469 RepID=A0A9P5CQ74_CRYP1|nr:metallothionein-I gene transcription activator [Cryphonectria parasitica EP155]KAF3766923.1 metallothionein-I gene transcription activator [Cryphonectria parasitica EP155]